MRQGLKIMNKVIEYLLEFGFSRTINPISRPVVIHSVAGAGKSTLIRKIISEVPNSQAFTLALEDNPNLSGNRIRKLGIGEIDEGKINILDEYLLQEVDLSKFDFVFADPCQITKGQPLPAHYIKDKTERVPAQICEFLSEHGLHSIKGEKSGSLSVSEFFGPIPTGQILCYQKEVFDYLQSYSIRAKFPCEVQGKEFETVTLFITGDPKIEAKCLEFYCCATRATSTLNIRAHQ